MTDNKLNWDKYSTDEDKKEKVEEVPVVKHKKKKKSKKKEPVEEPPKEYTEKEKEYFCVGDVPEGGIATYNQGYFIPHKTFNEIISKYNSEIKELKNTLENKEIEYDKLKRKYDKLLDEVS